MSCVLHYIGMLRLKKYIRKGSEGSAAPSNRSIEGALSESVV